MRNTAVSSLVCASLLFGSRCLSAQQTTQKPAQSVLRSPAALSGPDQKLLDTVNTVAMGQKLLPKSWPNSARVAVMLTFDDDTQSYLMRDGITEPTALSATDYGAQTGTPRLLEILDRHKVPATFLAVDRRRFTDSPGDGAVDAQERPQ